jgi:hypothetical protein
MSAKRHVLFHSQYCDYSKAAAERIIKRGARSLFMFVCVDGGQHKLPAFVDRVPLMYAYDGDGNGHVLTEDNLFEFIERVLVQDAPAEDVTAYCVHEMGGAYSDSFSYIEPTTTGEHVPEGSKHTFANVHADFHIQTPDADPIAPNAATGGPRQAMGNAVPPRPMPQLSSGAGGGPQASSLDKLMAQRDADLQQIFK